MGAIHIQWEEIEDAALHGTAVAGPIVTVRDHDVELRIEERFTRQLPRRKPAGFFARLFHRQAAPPAEETRTFAISPEPHATDSFSHPLFVRLAGELPVREVKAGDRVFVVQAMFVCLLRDDAPTRARVRAAFDRSADSAWAGAASPEELHRALLERKRWDAALDELRHRKALDPGGLAALLPADRLPGLGHIVGDFSAADRRRFVEGAARHLTQAADRTALARALFDRIQLQQMEPLLLLLAAEDPALELARIRLRMILDEEPHRAAEFTRLAAHLKK